jgi:hypothetical protein
VLAFGIHKKHWFVPKTDRNPVFLGYDTHIPDWLFIMAKYISFYGFLKRSNFGSKFKGITLQFYRKTTICCKN